LDQALTTLKIVTAFTGVVGYLAHGILATPEIQSEMIYQDRNPLYGDVIKYTLYAINFCLVVCALCPWWKLSATPLWAWASVVFAGLAYALYAIESKTIYRKRLLIGFVVRACIALLVTYLTNAALLATNA
jgi:hypothetical protein